MSKNNDRNKEMEHDGILLHFVMLTSFVPVVTLPTVKFALFKCCSILLHSNICEILVR